MEANSKIPFLRGDDPSKFLSGDGSWVNDTKDNIITFTSKDVLNPTSLESVSILTSEETHKSILYKISCMFKNIRFLTTIKTLYGTDLLTDMRTDPKGHIYMQSIGISYVNQTDVWGIKIGFLKILSINIKIISSFDEKNMAGNKIAKINDSIFYPKYYPHFISTLNGISSMSLQNINDTINAFELCGVNIESNGDIYIYMLELKI